MDVAASVVGLLAAGAKVYLFLDEFISGCVDAPLIAQSTCDEVRDFRYTLAKLQPYVDGSTSIKLLGAEATDINHLSFTLTACVATFSRLEKLLDRLISRGTMDTLSRLRWSWAEADVSQLVQRLQQHKSSLTLLLTIWTSESTTEVAECCGQLTDQMGQLVSQLTQQKLLQSLAGSLGNTDHHTFTNATSTMSGSASVMTVGSVSSRLYRSFESTLFAARPYRGISNQSVISFATSERRGTRWSIFSGGSNSSVFSLPISVIGPAGISLAEVPAISSITLPVHLENLYDSRWYNSNNIASILDSTPLPTKTLPLTLSRQQHLSSNLTDAAQKGDVATVQLLLRLGAGIETKDKKGRTPLHLAVLKGHKETVELLLDRGAKIEAQDKELDTALHYAVQYGQAAIVRLLLDRKADIQVKNDQSFTPLHYAAQYGQAAIVGLLLDRKADIQVKDDQRFTPLHYAVQYGQAAIVELLLDRGADIQTKDNQSATPLHYAVQYGQAAIVELLLDRGADIEAKYIWNATPLHYAARYGQVAIVKILLDRGIDIHAKDDQSATPLHYAVQYGQAAIVELLLDRGVDIQVKDDQSATPLHYAAQYGQTATELLLDRGADIQAKDSWGHIPLSYAIQHGQAAIVKLLDRGAQANPRTKT